MDNEKSYQSPAGVKKNKFLRVFKKLKNMDFWISVFFSGFLAISREPKEPPEICLCQNNHILYGFSDSQTIWILDCWISGFCLAFLAISRDQKELPEIRWFLNNRNLRFFFQIFQRKLDFGLVDFCISVFLYFWPFWRDFWPYLRNNKSYQRSAGSKTTGFLDFGISVILTFLGGDFWLYPRNEKSYHRSVGVKKTGILRTFQISAWVTRPERPTGAKDEVEQAKRA